MNPPMTNGYLTKGVVASYLVVGTVVASIVIFVWQLSDCWSAEMRAMDVRVTRLEEQYSSIKGDLLEIKALLREKK